MARDVTVSLAGRPPIRISTIERRTIAMKPAILKAFVYAMALLLLLPLVAPPAQAADKITKEESNINMDAARIYASNNAGCAKRLAALRVPPALISPQPNWVDNNKCLLQALIVEIQENRFPYRFQYNEAVGSQPAKLKIQLEGDFEETGRDPVAMPLATYPCMAFDFRAKVAGAWGSECRVLKVITPFLKVTKVPAPFPGAEEMHEYSWTKPGKQSIRFIVENGAGKQMDCTLVFNIKVVNDKG